MTTAERVREIVSTELQVERDRVVDDATPQELGANSLDVVEIVMGIEEDFGMEVPDEDVVDIKTIGDLVRYVEGRCAIEQDAMNRVASGEARVSYAVPDERQVAALERIANSLADIAGALQRRAP